MARLTPTMLEGLRRMAKRLDRRSSVMAEPNENTGKALLKRGLVEVVHERGGWNHYRLTEAGRRALAEQEKTR